jgi:cytochrome d ubiquinol oxidase subunit II
LVAFWGTALGVSLLLYVVLDGFDLGVGILFPFAPGERSRQQMMEAVAPVWDGNETWLIMSAATLFAAFPAAYAVLLSAFYLPVIIMLCGLILRGVAFEFRSRTVRYRWLWSASFFLGSLFAAFAQGSAIGAFVQQVPVHDGVFDGSVFSWLSPFALLCGVGLCLGYSMLGAGWLVLKTEAAVRDFSYASLAVTLSGVMVFLLAAAVSVFAMHLRVADQWRQRPVLFVFLAIGAVALLTMLYAIVRERDRVLYPMAVVMFCAAFCTMVLAVLPYIVPFSMTLAEAAAPKSSLTFLFWGAGIIVLPLTLIYTGVVYFIFRGKVVRGSGAD